MNKLFPRCLLLATLASAPLAQAADPAACDVVRFSEVGWTDLIVTNTVARLLFDELGYRTEIRRLSAPETYRALNDGQVDAFLGNWMPSSTADIQPYLDKGSIEMLAANLEGAKYTLAVTREAWEGGVKSFADLARHKERFKGEIVGLEPGNNGNELVKKMIAENAFGLAEFRLLEAGESRMMASVRHAQALKQWRVFLGWAPHPMNDEIAMEYLAGGDQYFGPDYGGATVYTNTRAGYSAQCPNAARLLKNLRFSMGMVNQLMAAVLAGNTNPRREAKTWLQANPQARAQWLEGVTRRDGSPHL
ncbi:choline ABC transporter substrate-binding protein [Pseudomonas oryzae]|uniref:Glycine betaine/proline transport system substrate-binding protein n=1 Tax=Pseudomonas oryzae TaxID=1392877 RepID=A0A1H1ZAX4_9PSED|nr:choline ABC transporter substrate-binding protein [Pseudomonas oryzae]SDT30717.1 glycine betaine/proline transport system substrate-binding protein [Pseudomonas oryzae]